MPVPDWNAETEWRNHLEKKNGKVVPETGFEVFDGDEFTKISLISKKVA